ncbi:hypothetical protein BDV18DRAFT_127371 [Aspergillus unguis]
MRRPAGIKCKLEIERGPRKHNNDQSTQLGPVSRRGNFSAPLEDVGGRSYYQLARGHSQQVIPSSETRSFACLLEAACLSPRYVVHRTVCRLLGPWPMLRVSGRLNEDLLHSGPNDSTPQDEPSRFRKMQRANHRRAVILDMKDRRGGSAGHERQRVRTWEVFSSRWRPITGPGIWSFQGCHHHLTSPCG